MLLSTGKEITLNSVYLKNRILELCIKQWWLAEQIGVDRRTVTRWLQGSVKSVQRENAEALAQVLGCTLHDLSLANVAEQLATVDDQKRAAALIAGSSLVEKLGPLGEWNVIESLLKATIVPGLPKSVLGQLYNQLTVASWRQNKVDQADLYNKKAVELAEQCGDKGVYAGALLSKANIYSWRGNIGQAIITYRNCLDLRQYIEPRTSGAAYSNLGAVLYEAGLVDEGAKCLADAIEIFNFHGTPTNLSIAWCHLAMINLQKHDLNSAKVANARAVAFALQDEYRRGLAMGKLIDAELAAREARTSDAKECLADGLASFDNLGIQEGLNYEFAGRILRLLGEYGEAAEFLRKGILISNSFPVYQAALYAELAKTLVRDEDHQIEAKAAAMKAVELYVKCEAYAQVPRVKNLLQSMV